METFKTQQDLKRYIYGEVRKRKEHHKSDTLIRIIQEVFKDETIAQMLGYLFVITEKDIKQHGSMTKKDLIDFIFETIDGKIKDDEYEAKIALIKSHDDEKLIRKRTSEKSLFEEEKIEQIDFREEDINQTDNGDDGPVDIDIKFVNPLPSENRRRTQILDPISTDVEITELDKFETLQALNPLTIEERYPDLSLILIDKYYDELSFFEKEAFKLRILRKSGFYNNNPKKKLIIQDSEYFTKLGAEYRILTMLFSEEEILSLQRRAAIKISMYWEKNILPKVRERVYKIMAKYY